MALQYSKRLAQCAIGWGLLLAPLGACESAPPSPYVWKEFVSARGHANLIPKQWVATPEGKFAHELVIPNPVAADSGYKPGMSAGEYYRHLCDTEAGDFIFKKVDNVEGLYFARPPKSPSRSGFDGSLEAGTSAPREQVSSLGSLHRKIGRVIFVNPPWYLYRFYEEPNQDSQVRPAVFALE
jgi:hypothetical protein